jgi:hypothetical protein
VYTEAMKQIEAKDNNSRYIGKDLVKSFVLSLIAIAIVVALYYVWK